MAILRIDWTHIDDAWYEFVQAGISDREIPEMQVTYFTNLNDTHSDIIADPNYVRYGAQFYVSGQPTGLYAGRSSLKRIGQDANVDVWRQTFKVSSIQPRKIGRDPNPLNRDVEFLERVGGFRNVSTIIDWNNNPVVNRAGDYLSGFEVEVPSPVYRYAGNFESIPSWALDLDGGVNGADKVLPIRYRDPDGTLTTVDNLTLRAGTAKLRITQLPMVPTEENNVQYFPIQWEYQVSHQGWSEPLLNQGFNESVYLDSSGNVVNTAAVIAGTYNSVEKRQILDDKGEPVRDPVLLDWFGRKLKIPALSNQSQGTVNTTTGLYQMSQGTAVFDEDWVGMYVKIVPSGAIKLSQAFLTTITHVNAGIATFTDPAPYTWVDADVYFPAISAISFAAVPYVDMSAIPV
ncbi:MAG: hypothetical protein RIK87_08410 [Fuerstiella sp.]